MTVADTGREELDVCPRVFRGMVISITKAIQPQWRLLTWR
jgi:hypothetical protein